MAYQPAPRTPLNLSEEEKIVLAEVKRLSRIFDVPESSVIRILEYVCRD
jgi:hypothetical protein